MQLLLLAILPGLLISFYIYRTDKHEPEPHKQLIWCFIFGVLSTAPAIMLERFGHDMGFTKSEDLVETFIYAFGVIAFSEEIVKFVFLRFYIYPKKYFNEPMDGIVYAMMIGMGFATLENILYAYSFGMNTAILRMFTAVPAHAAFAVFMGYYVGLAKFDKKQETKHLLLGLLGAVLLHGAYDFFLFQENYPGLTGLAFVCLAIGIYYSIKMIKIHQENSPFQYVEDTTEEDIDWNA